MKKNSSDFLGLANRHPVYILQTTELANHMCFNHPNKVLVSVGFGMAPSWPSYHRESDGQGLQGSQILCRQAGVGQRRYLTSLVKVSPKNSLAALLPDLACEPSCILIQRPIQRHPPEQRLASVKIYLPGYDTPVAFRAILIGKAA